MFGGPNDAGWDPDESVAPSREGAWSDDGLWDDADHAVAQTQSPEVTASSGCDFWGPESSSEPAQGDPAPATSEPVLTAPELEPPELTAPEPQPDSPSPSSDDPAAPENLVYNPAELANLDAFDSAEEASPSGLELEEPPSAPAAAALPANGSALDGIEPEKLEAIIRDVARSILERIAWEVVPDLAEEIIKDELDRLTK